MSFLSWCAGQITDSIRNKNTVEVYSYDTFKLKIRGKFEESFRLNEVKKKVF